MTHLEELSLYQAADSGLCQSVPRIQGRQGVAKAVATSVILGFAPETPDKSPATPLPTR